MDMEKLFQTKAFEAIDKEKRQVMAEMAKACQGKNMMDTIQIFTKYQKKLTGGRPLNAEEKKALLEVMQLSMNEKEKENFSKMMLTLKSMGYGI